MSVKSRTCGEIADDLLACALGEAAPEAVGRVERHAAVCAACRRELQAFRDLDRTVAALGDEPVPPPRVDRARRRLEAGLSDLRARLLAYRIFPSLLGPILIARSELGIALIEYLDRGADLEGSRLSREARFEAVEGGADLEAAHRDLTEYLAGRRLGFDWPLDLRLVRSDFHRAVLEATAAIPYGAVTTYAGIAERVGKASAPRAAAQALRWNPLPIVIPCHRVIGTTGSLTGYAGRRLDLKERLLTLEGIPLAKGSGIPAIRPQAMYVRYPGDQEYCLPTCPSLQAQRAASLTRIASRQIAEAAGLLPCMTCRPDLHPLSQ